jgi:hypothetical protein
MKKFGVNNFARTRHTKFSPYSYFTGTEAELLAMIEDNFSKGRPGNREGVIIVPVDTTGFFSGVCVVQPGMHLQADFKARREGEDPFVQVTAKAGFAHKAQAKIVEIILYSKDAMGPDATEGAEWEVISINARETLEDEPQHPISMARNLLGLPGGTKVNYTAEDFAKSIIYWSNRVNCS